MNIKQTLKLKLQSLLRLCGYVLIPTEKYVDKDRLYNDDGLTTIHNQAFRKSRSFSDAYDRGLVAANGADPRHHWRVNIALWAAKVALRAEGNFVECGVNAGFMSSAIMQALEWNSLDRNYFLIDSFEGPRLSDLNHEELASGRAVTLRDAMRREAYVVDIERVKTNFSEWPSAKIIKGFVPDVLQEVEFDRVAFLHLDMNAAEPEKTALRYFWPKLPEGGVVLLDDYAYCGYENQKDAIDELGTELGFATLSLPTGQGLIFKD